MVWDLVENQFILPACEECAQVLGINKYYTLGCVEEDFDSRKAFVKRRQLLGNPFNCYADSSAFYVSLIHLRRLLRIRMCS